jgi:glycine/D-amino acid oxidase-like deaminating enzyme/nitrite reductase/ring-hydroxylating ferredoxin subunit
MATAATAPLWDDTPLPSFGPLDRGLRVDVAIVGGGLAGITAALLLRQAGCTVALLERRRIGGVDTASTTAHLTAVTDLDLVTLADRFGRDHAQAVWDAGFAAIDRIETLVTTHGIDCDFRRVPGYRHVPFDFDAAAAPDAVETPDALETQLADLRAEADLARTLGFDVDMIQTTPLVGRPGWRIEHQALFHPRKYLKGLLEQLTNAGVVICEQSEVTFGDDPEVLTSHGHEVRARHVFVATHNPLVGRQSAAAAALMQTHLSLTTSYVVAARIERAEGAERLGRDERGERGERVGGLDHAALWWDTSEPYRYMRVEPDGGGLRLIAGGEDHKTGQEADTQTPYATLERWCLELLPSATITHRWSGQVIETTDGLPFIGEAGTRQYIATGFAGNGMTFGTLAAMIVRDAIVGDVANPWRELFDAGRSAILRGPVDYLRSNADYPYYMIRDRFAGADTRQVRDVPRGEGRLVDLRGQLVAASRDDRGRLTLLSPVCTHLGCRVGWNTAERTWDCPCHGSRFSATGEVLAGPAEAPLKPVSQVIAQASKGHRHAK